ncbi:MAG: FadR family transcriptional regulator [Actinobacteria bacterium]|jgi:GntR family transcriptional repressor for pyruvate dehydrogenase complex|nr:FadR family transcriptional regulator [Actinomycetota bacterium]NDA39297.1 FadR family transcriptional regulator [Actinomycetota bacterium]NDE13049.1 FadR family transcriptional regulator [Actinomycetota bacterium]NDE83850.1 FadR family transcriptional regulator [Actinomycetota bacterium]
MNPPILKTAPRSANQARLLLDYIESENLNPGDRLAPERELSKKLGISRSSLREAIQVLQTQGRLLVRHGIGVFLANHSIEELFEMREILEAPAVEWAAQRRSEAQLLSIKEAARALRAAIAESPIDFEKVRLLDMNFHLTIVKSAENQFLNQTLGTLQEIMFRSMDNTLKLPGRIEASEHEHGVIVDAIEKQDQLAARLMIIEHIHNARDAWIKYLKKVDA